jgi:phage terminase Nu1 subunit (DNA packaging protein)
VSAGGKSSIARRADLAAALKSFKKREHITIEDLALLWGVTKARFVNLRGQIADFPLPIGKDGNALLYEARPAIESLLRYESRNDTATAARSSKVARILGASAPDEESALPASEMLALARARAEVQKQQKEQGTLVTFAEVQEVAAEVFGEISNVLGKLSDSVDPNGKLPATVRAILDDLGKDLLLRSYNRMNDMLSDDVDGHPPGATKARARPDRPRRAKVSRKRARRV